jgi:hypothetical protein
VKGPGSRELAAASVDLEHDETDAVQGMLVTAPVLALWGAPWEITMIPNGSWCSALSPRALRHVRVDSYVTDVDLGT